MKTKLFILSFITVCMITILTYSGQQEPVFEFEKKQEAYRKLGLDLKGGSGIRTGNYEYLFNFKNNHTLVRSREGNHEFIRVNITYAYYIVCEDMGGSEKWRMYQVEKLDKKSPITRLFFEMKKELDDCTKKGCLRNRCYTEKFINLAKLVLEKL